MYISIIAAVAENGVIGKDNRLPWEGQLPRDLSFFQNTTRGHAVVAGRKTFESIFARLGKPLPKRTNIVVSHTMPSREDARVVRSFDDAIASAPEGENELFVIGGTSLYREALVRAHRMYLTKIAADFEGDAFFPEFNSEQWRTVWQTLQPKDDKNAYDMTFVLLERKTT